MDDLFEREQEIYDSSLWYLEQSRAGDVCDLDTYETLVNEYGRLLRHVRRITKLSDKTTDSLNAYNLDLLDKVHYDGLTGIYNRRYVQENLVRIIRTSRRNCEFLSVLMVDIDFFKRFNDTYGHSAGDKCLRAVAGALSGCISRAGDFVARYGGEEFIAVLPGTEEPGARFIAERMLDNVHRLGFLHKRNDASEYVTVSIGVTSGKVMPFINGDDFIKMADKALYMSKESGRNKYMYLGLTEADDDS